MAASDAESYSSSVVEKDQVGTAALLWAGTPEVKVDSDSLMAVMVEPSGA